MTADTGLPLTSRGTIIDKPLISSDQDDLTETSFREDVSGFGGTRVGVGLLDGNSLTTVGGTVIGGQPLDGISGMFWDSDWPWGLWTELWPVNSVLDHLTTLEMG